MDDIEHIHILLDERKTAVNQRFQDMDKATSAALQAANEALRNVATDIQSKFASVNEFRGALSDQQKNFPTREEMQAMISPLASQLQTINNLVMASQGKGSGVEKTIGYIIGAIGLIVAILVGTR